MRFLQNSNGDSVGYSEIDRDIIDALLAAGWTETPCMHPGAREVVWRRDDGTIAVDIVLPHTLDRMEFARQMLALDKQAAVDAVTTAEASLNDSFMAIRAAEKLINDGARASQLLAQLPAQIQGVRDQSAQQLGQMQRDAVAAVAALERRDAELVLIEQAGAAAQAELARQQAREQAATITVSEAQASIEAATITLAQADAALDALQTALTTGTAGENAAAEMAAALETRRGAEALLVEERQRLANAQLKIAEAVAAMTGLQQVIAQAAQASTERQAVADQIRTRSAQHDADKAALFAATTSSVAELEQQDTQLATVVAAGEVAANNMAAIQASHVSRKAALAEAVRLVEDIATGEQIAASEGTSLDEYVQLRSRQGMSVAAVYPAEVKWRPDWPAEGDMVFDPGQNAVVVDIDRARETTRQRLRAERAPLFAALDLQFMRNLEVGVDNSEVVAEKNRLRDITLLPGGCATLEELKGLGCAKG